MSTAGIRPISYKQLILDQKQIRIPRLQRDYAQGRASQAEVREQFLDTLERHLKLPAGDPKLPLNLDFIYGSKADDAFLPLDGQQRLTTLFLLHWYLAWVDDCWPEFEQLFRGPEHARFSYSVRTTSVEFFDKLVANPPQYRPGEIEMLSEWLTDQSWYFRYWRLDPTIQAALNMLDAMHRRFGKPSGLFARLTSDVHPAITFQLLDLQHFRLTDDLYIKMNARGKPLTAFETFKAQYEQGLKKQFPAQTRKIAGKAFPIAEFVARRLDTAWADFFWSHREDTSEVYDDAVMKLFRIVALVSRNPQSERFGADIALLRDENKTPAYSTFQSEGWLDEDFTLILIALLETWSAADNLSKPILDAPFFNDLEMFSRIIEDPSNLSAQEVVMFCGYALFVLTHEGRINPQHLRAWMRVIHNLAINSDVDRSDRLQNAFKGLHELLPHSTTILEHLAGFSIKGRITGFTEQQVREEAIKATLLLGHSKWKPLIERAEHHGYFRGQVDFLCEFSGVSAQWQEAESTPWADKVHRKLQDQFEFYLARAERTFTPSGLDDLNKAAQFLWERALLSLGDYLLPSGGHKYSFLVNASTEPTSWKRLLRGGDARNLLKEVWDRLDMEESLPTQLKRMISEAKNLPVWREAIVQTPEAISYCERRLIHWESEAQVYLLRKAQMNGQHAELFTFCLYQRLQKPKAMDPFQPFELGEYGFRTDRYDEPHFSLEFQRDDSRLAFLIYFHGNKFHVWTDLAPLQSLPKLRKLLEQSASFAENEGWLEKIISLDVIEKDLNVLATLLKTSQSEVSA